MIDDLSGRRRGRPLSVWALIGLLAVLGVRGVLGGGQFLLAPSGRLVGLSTAALAGSPFRSFLLPGLILFVVLGFVPLAVAVGLYRGRRWGPAAAFAVAVALAVWVAVEGFVIGFGERLQYPNVAQAVAMALFAVVARKRYGAD